MAINNTNTTSQDHLRDGDLSTGLQALASLLLMILVVGLTLHLMGGILPRNQHDKATYPQTESTPSSFTGKMPPSIQMFYAINLYADSFNIPLRYAYGIAHTETGYDGPFDWDYNPAQTSSAGALGPMQVMLATATHVNGSAPTRVKLKCDIDYNVRTSMKLLRMMYDRNHDWLVTFGQYNTGKPLVNGYSHKVYNYKPHWHIPE